MQETSSLYKRLLADPGHWKEYTLVIGETGVLVDDFSNRITFGGTAILVATTGADSGFRESSIILTRGRGFVKRFFSPEKDKLVFV